MKLIIHDDCSKVLQDIFSKINKIYPTVQLECIMARSPPKSRDYKNISIYYDNSLFSITCTISVLNLSSIIRACLQKSPLISISIFEKKDCLFCEDIKNNLQTLLKKMQTKKINWILDKFSPYDLKDDRVKELLKYIKTFGYPSVVLRRFDNFQITDAKEIFKIKAKYIVKEMSDILDKPQICFFASQDCQACQEFQKTWIDLTSRKDLKSRFIFTKKQDDEIEDDDYIKYNIYYYPTLVYKSPSGKLFKFELERSEINLLNFLEEVQKTHLSELSPLQTIIGKHRHTKKKRKHLSTNTKIIGGFDVNDPLYTCWTKNNSYNSGGSALKKTVDYPNEIYYYDNFFNQGEYNVDTSDINMILQDLVLKLQKSLHTKFP